MKKKTDLAQCVRDSLAQYLDDLGDATPANLYDMVIDFVERPILEVVMARLVRAIQFLERRRCETGSPA